MAHTRPYSEVSIDSSEVSVESSSGHEEEDEEYKIPHGIPFLSVIHKFTKVKEASVFDIKPSWSGMNLTSTNKDQLDMQILAQRMVYLTEKAALDCKVVAALSMLLENDGQIIRKYMPRSDADYVIDCFRKQNIVSENRPQVRTAAGFAVDKSLLQAYRLLTQQKCFPRYVEKHPPKMTPFLESFINALGNFKKYLCKYLELAAYEVAVKTVKQRQLLEVLGDRRAELKRLQGIVDDNISEYQTKFNQRDVQIVNMELELRQTIEYFNGLMNACLHMSDKILYITGEASSVVQAELSESAKDSQVLYATTLDSHLAAERMMRTRKIKLESQLAMWLSKYDTDVGEKQHVLDIMAEGFERENAEVQELECLMVEQESIYLRYLEEEEEEKLDFLKQQLYVIASTRAARIIQHYWRAYIARKATKKGNKKKKGKKGKK